MSFKVNCKYDSEFFIEADLNYQSLSVAQEDYQNPIEREKGQFINIEMRQEEENAIDASVTLSVEDAENLEIQILGLCQAVKREASAATEANIQTTIKKALDEQYDRFKKTYSLDSKY